MKLVAGLQKGRRLKQPVNRTLRPTSAKVREALFAILGNRVRNAAVLDLYAGTGALGLEALSRGARKAVFIDQDPSSLRILRDNILRCASQGKSRVIRQDVNRFLRTLAPGDRTEPFDLVFLDPPYHTGEAESVLEVLGRTTVLAPSGIVVLEHCSKHRFPAHTGNLKEFRKARYGDTTLSFYSMLATSQDPSCA